MKRKACHILVLLVIFVGIIACGPSDPEIVFRAYSQAFLAPETFDQYASAELAPRADDFFDCLARVQTRLVEAHQEAIKHCDELPAEYQENCRQTDAAAISGALSAIASVVRGEVSWQQTQYGLAAIIGKTRVPHVYVPAQRAVLEVFRPVLFCG
jgi:hypothetical protein